MNSALFMFLATINKPKQLLYLSFINEVKVAFTTNDKLPELDIPTGHKDFNGEDIAPLQAVHFTSDVDRSSQRAGRIPEGR